MRPLLRRLYAGWMAFGRFLGHVNLFIILTVLYVVVLPLFSLIRFRDPLGKSRRRLRSATLWTPMKPHPQDLELLYRPF